MNNNPRILPKLAKFIVIIIVAVIIYFGYSYISDMNFDFSGDSFTLAQGKSFIPKNHDNINIVLKSKKDKTVIVEYIKDGISKEYKTSLKDDCTSENFGEVAVNNILLDNKQLYITGCNETKVKFLFKENTKQN